MFGGHLTQWVSCFNRELIQRYDSQPGMCTFTAYKYRNTSVIYCNIYLGEEYFASGVA